MLALSHRGHAVWVFCEYDGSRGSRESRGIARLMSSRSTPLEEADMANDDIKTPRPGSDSEEMMGSEGVGSDTEFDTEEFDDEESDDEESGDEESETE
jgi:hypothetical protein